MPGAAIGSDNFHACIIADSDLFGYNACIMAYQIFEDIAAELGPAAKASGITTDGLAKTLSFCDINFGDVSSNVALQNAKKVGANPMDLAQNIASKLSATDIVASAEAVAPGFVNIRLQPSYLINQLSTIEELGVEKWLAANVELKPKKIVMDYSHPNMGKPMGVHHLLSTVIGDAIKRLYRGLGVEVIADNFIGDLGTQFGKLIWAVKQWGDLESIEANPVAELLKLYVRFHIEADADVELDDAGRAEYQKLEAGDPENRALWQKICNWSMTDVDTIYRELGVEFDYIHGESFYEDKMQPIIDQGIDSGYFVESDGALVAPMKDPNMPPAIVRKQDGTTLYLTRDLARIAFWDQEWKPDTMLVVVDSAQRLHFQQVFEVADRLQLTKAQNLHVAFGRMRFRDASMSTRKGNILLLSDLLSEAKKRVAKLEKEKNNPIESTKVDQIAIGAIKYGILQQNRQSDIVFDWDSLLSLEGNSAPYIMYGYARTRSVQEKQTAKQTESGKPPGSLTVQERALVLACLATPLSLQSALDDFDPHMVCEACHQISQLYNKFYNTSKIISGDDSLNYRSNINKTVGLLLQHNMRLLGIEMPEHM